MTITDIAGAVSALASLGTLVFAVVIWLQGKRTHATAEATKTLVNGASVALLKLTGDTSFEAGRTEGRISRIEERHDAQPPS